MNNINNQHRNARKNGDAFGNSRGVFFSLLAALLFIAGISAGTQSDDELRAYFQERSIPLSSIQSEAGTVTAQIGLTEASDVSPQNLERNNAAVFRKLAAAYPDSSLLRLEYLLEGEPFNILEIDTADVLRPGAESRDDTAVLAHARLGVVSSLQERVSSELDAIRESDERAEPAAEFSLPERTVALPDEPVVSGGGGGGGGRLARPSGPGGTLIFIFAFLFGSLALAFAIFMKRGRTKGPNLNIQATLTVYYSDGGSKIFPIREEITRIGRSEDNSLVLNDDQISGHHADIIVRGKRFYIEDRESTNGTIVNGRKTAGSPLFLGDEIRLGTTRLIFSE